MEDEDVEGRTPDVRRSAEYARLEEAVEEKEEPKGRLNASTEVHVTQRTCGDASTREGSREDEQASECRKDSPSRGAVGLEKTQTKVTFKGFKKRILSETRENQISTLRTNYNRAVGKKRRDKKGVSAGASEAKRGKITEYAQYLGLQPASNKVSCANCRGTTNSCDSSMIDQNRCTCSTGIMTQSPSLASPGTSETCTGPGSPTTQSSSAANNFRITRKVYLCAACGTYFENWNLFLHMREIHKRHICLFCLGMFGQAERLSYHLTKKHNVPEIPFTSVEDFYNVFKGSCYLICCTCEKVFAETDNFYNHFCSPVQKGRAGLTSEICSLCRQSVNNHSSGCNHADSGNPSNADLPGIPGVPMKTGDSKSTVARGGHKRMLKNNRLKRNEVSPLTLYQQKMANLYANRTKFKSQENSTGNTAVNLVEDSSTLRELETGTITSTTTTTTAATATVTATVTAKETITIPATCSVAISSRIEPTDTDTTSTVRDTVSETIMEVSKCTDDPTSKDVSDEPFARVIDVNSSPIKAPSIQSPSFSSSSLSSPLRQQIDAPACYDSVTETIMEVSRCYNENELCSSDDDESDGANERFARNETSSRDSDVDALVMDDAALSDGNDESSNVAARYNDRLKDALNTGTLGNERRRKRRRMHGRNVETIRDSDSEEDSNSSENEATNLRERDSTPTNDVSRSRNSVTRERNFSQSSSSPDKESRSTAVSFTTVNSTDRSLVIKICTNRNAQFSVTRSDSNGNSGNHDVSRESEENNNAEDSTSEGKASNRSEQGDRDSVNSCHEDDDEERSDANSIKLSVDDTKPVQKMSAVLSVASPAANETDDYIQVDDDDEVRKTSDNVASENCPETQNLSENITEEVKTETDEKPESVKAPSTEESDGIVIAPDDVPSTDLNVDGILESMRIEDLLKRCISAASGFCVYCNHARHIAVNGKQLGLHVLAEHRFQPQHPAIIIQREQLILLLKKSLDELSTKFFNLDSYDETSGTYHVAAPRVFECFHCRYHSLVHKEIYLHNRKMHQKTILICIMCKSTFYSYSELLCHLCPGVYSPNINVTYRCCLCPVTNLPSAFRLMVHLRKRHHSCDVCLESTGNQQRLSNHVWKHKLHHLCYRCGIAYRNKPDITKHLFWKHGTESVLCKKCLQKKWPHVYHFCIPPTAFVCEECASTFTRAVALKVHKRLHSGDRPYGCGECDERFISKKLAARHEARHREPETIEQEVTAIEGKKVAAGQENKTSPDKPIVDNKAIEDTTTLTIPTATTDATTTTTATTTDTSTTATANATSQVSAGNENSTVPSCESKDPKESVKKVVDVYDLPPLNLSSDSDTDVEESPAPVVTPKDPIDRDIAAEERPKIPNEATHEIPEATEKSSTDQCDGILDVELNEEAKKEEAEIMDGIWDNFKTYAASLEQRDSTIDFRESKIELLDREYLCKVILADHDYCVVYTEKSIDEAVRDEEGTRNDENCATMEREHDYGYKVAKSPSNTSVILNCDSDTNTGNKRKKDKTPKKKIGNTSSSESSSDSDSSSCSCGTNCSCSSSSSDSTSSSSSSSDSDSSASESSPRKQNARKERRREKVKDVSTEPEVPKVNASKPEQPTETIEPVNVVEETDRKDTIEETAEPNVEVNDHAPSPQLVFRESDLDTDETETDEDFYDEHPQQLANRLLAEKRNQLMLLAAVAPPVTEAVSTVLPATHESLHNGTVDLTGNTNSLEPPTSLNVGGELVYGPATTSAGVARKRVKTKKRKKSDRGRTARAIGTSNAPPTVESIKLNIPKSFYDKKPKKFGSKAPPLVTLVPSRSSTPSITNSLQHSENAQQTFPNDATKAVSVAGSGSENENKRSSKRKRVPKRFYGDSSDEEAQHTDHHHHHHHHRHQVQQQQPQAVQHYNQPSLKWRKVEPPVLPSASIKTPTPVLQTANSNYGTKSVTLRLSGFDRPMERIVPIVTGPSESEEQVESSTAESSENEDAGVIQAPQQVQQPQQPQPPQPQQCAPPNYPVVHHQGPNTTRMAGPNPLVGTERSVNLYCYCQCPYDEVSDMIACDGNDCRIEWFHFECVGIMVPPKGKWYCPDCRRRDSTLVNDDFPE